MQDIKTYLENDSALKSLDFSYKNLPSMAEALEDKYLQGMFMSVRVCIKKDITEKCLEVIRKSILNSVLYCLVNRGPDLEVLESMPNLQEYKQVFTGFKSPDINTVYVDSLGPRWQIKKGKFLYVVALKDSELKVRAANIEKLGTAILEENKDFIGDKDKEKLYKVLLLSIEDLGCKKFKVACDQMDKSLHYKNTLGGK